MNRTLNGENLTSADLLKIAEDNGLMTDKLSGEIVALHNSNLIHSLLIQLTAEVRLAMFQRGELNLGCEVAFPEATGDCPEWLLKLTPGPIPQPKSAGKPKRPKR